MSSSSSREAARLPPQVNGEECSGTAFRWRLTPQRFSDLVICRLPPTMHVYVIHPDGLIKKHIPRAVTPGYEDAIFYKYLDSSGVLYELGIYRFKEVQRYKSGNVPVDGKSLIIDLRSVSHSWKGGDLKYGFSLATTRPFIGDVALASFFGAMLETGFTDIVSTGFSTSMGQSEISVSHVNGTNGDFRYLRNDGKNNGLHIAKSGGRPHLLDEDRQAEFIDALRRFGWKSMLSYRYQRNGESRLLKGTTHYDGHHHHLHLQGYSPTMEEVHE